MKTLLVICISLGLAWTTLAAPLQWTTKPDLTSLKNQLFKSIISQALIQQEDSPSAKDKEMAATYCKLLIQVLQSFNKELVEDLNIADYCGDGEDVELPPEPRPEDKSSTLTKAYQKILNILKNTDLENIYGNLSNG